MERKPGNYWIKILVTENSPPLWVEARFDGGDHVQVRDAMDSSGDLPVAMVAEWGPRILPPGHPDANDIMALGDPPAELPDGFTVSIIGGTVLFGATPIWEGIDPFRMSAEQAIALGRMLLSCAGRIQGEKP